MVVPVFLLALLALALVGLAVVAAEKAALLLLVALQLMEAGTVRVAELAEVLDLPERQTPEAAVVVAVDYLFLEAVVKVAPALSLSRSPTRTSLNSLAA